jgi:predicted dehydrogenase
VTDLPPRVLVAGTGSIGRRHSENLATLGARVTALSWREAGLAGFEAALSGADAVVIATATDLRLPLIERAAAAGRPVYVEKPLAFRAAEVEAIAGAAAPVATRSLLGLMMRYHPAVRLLAASDLSDVFDASFAIGHDVRAWRKDWRFSHSYAAQPEGGGVLLDLCHELDLAAILCPGLRLAGVDCIGHSAYPGVDIATRVHLAAPGRTASVAMDYLAPELHRRALLTGHERMWEMDFAAGAYRCRDRSGWQSFDLPLERNAMFLDAMRDFLALVRGRPASNLALLPRLDRVRPGVDLVAAAWEARRFIGQLTTDLP